MKSVGEVMAIGRTQQESLQKALRGLEVGSTGFDPKVDLNDPASKDKVISELRTPRSERIWYIGDAFRLGMSVQEVYEHSHVDPWFLVQIEDLIKEEAAVAQSSLQALDADRVYRLK